MNLPPLDAPTLFVVSALVIAFSGCVLIAARGTDEGAVPLVFWGGAMLAGAAGIVLLSLTPFTTLPAGPAGNAAILLGVALSWSGARVFAGRDVKPLLVVAGAGTWLVMHAALQEGPARLSAFLVFFLGAGYILATAGELWRGRWERLPTRGVAVALLIVHGLIYLGQAGAGLVSETGFVSPGTFTVLMLEALLHTTGMAFLFLALMKERAELRSTVQLRELATRDGLTGLGNRRTFDLLLVDEFRRAARTRAPLGLLMIDVDQFKAFNDTYGHQAGDECLRSVATCLQKAMHRAGDRATRYGGEEFAVLLPETDEHGTLSVAEDIRLGIEAMGVPHTGNVHGVVTASVGAVSWIPGATDRHDALLLAADRALYEAKAGGRNASRMADGPSRTKSIREISALLGGGTAGETRFAKDAQAS